MCIRDRYQKEGLGPGSTEDAPRRPPVRDTEELDDSTYGPCKVACEDDVMVRYGDRATIVRAGKVAGPHDPQRGLTYWVRRATRGGRGAEPASRGTSGNRPVPVLPRLNMVTSAPVCSASATMARPTKDVPPSTRIRMIADVTGTKSRAATGYPAGARRRRGLRATP